MPINRRNESISHGVLVSLANRRLSKNALVTCNTAAMLMEREILAALDEAEASLPQGQFTADLLKELGESESESV
jgi:hypothetical protein